MKFLLCQSITLMFCFFVTSRVLPYDIKPHQRITLQAAEVWLDIPQEISVHLSGDNRPDRTCHANYDVGDDVFVGSAEEDEEKNPFSCPFNPDERLLQDIGRFVRAERCTINEGRNGFFEHFWNPDEPNVGGYNCDPTDGVHYNQGLIIDLSGFGFGIFAVQDPPLGHYDSAYRLAQDYWDDKVLCHYTGHSPDSGTTCPVDRDQAYYWLGRVAHLLEDLTVPAHIHLLPHGKALRLPNPIAGVDLYEDFVKDKLVDRIAKESQDVVKGHEYKFESLPNFPCDSSCWEQIQPDATNLFKLFWYAAQKTQYFAARTSGAIGNPLEAGGNDFYVKLNGDPALFSPSLWEGEATPIETPTPLADRKQRDAVLQQMADALIPHALKAVAGLYRLFCLEVGIEPNCVFDYTLSNSGNIPVTQGFSGSNTITTTLLQGITEEVTLFVSGLPSFATATLTNNPCDPTCSSTLTISTSALTPTGSFPITVTGFPLNKTTTFDLVVAAPANGNVSIRRVGIAGTISSAPGGTSAFVDSLTSQSANPANFTNISAGSHTAFASDKAGFTETAGICNFPIGSAECAVSGFPLTPTCAGSFCSVPITVLENQVTKVVFKYVAVTPECSDGIDNDGNGLIDYPDDPGCDSPDDPEEGGGVREI